MTPRFAAPRIPTALTIASLVMLSGCVSGSGRRTVNVPSAAPPATSDAVTNSAQGLYESGRYRDVINSVNAGDRSAQALWFAAQSSLRLGQRDDATSQFAQLPQVGGNPVWQAVSDLALALLRDNPEEIDSARETAAAFPADPFVQYQLGLAHMRRNDLTAAAQAFDRCTQVAPRFAYASLQQRHRLRPSQSLGSGNRPPRDVRAARTRCARTSRGHVDPSDCPRPITI